MIRCKGIKGGQLLTIRLRVSAMEPDAFFEDQHYKPLGTYSHHRRQGSGTLLPSATKMLPSVALCQVEGWWAVMGPHEGTEHTQLQTAGQPHKQ